MKKIVLAVVFTFCAQSAQAAPLNIVNVSAPPINCLFDASCTLVVNDTTAPITLAGSGTGFLQSRTFRGVTGAPAAGLWAYLYRVDMRNAVGITNIACVNSVTMDFGPLVSTLDFNSDGAASDQVFVVTGGGLGTIGLSAADKVGNQITFTFSSPVCAGGNPGGGQSSFFWGLVSARQPRFITASITQTSAPAISVQARAPNYSFRPTGKLRRRSP